MPELAWYWWVLIVIAVIGIAYVKLVVAGNMMASMKAKKEAQERLAEED